MSGKNASFAGCGISRWAEKHQFVCVYSSINFVSVCAAQRKRKKPRNDRGEKEKRQWRGRLRGGVDDGCDVLCMPRKVSINVWWREGSFRYICAKPAHLFVIRRPARILRLHMCAWAHFDEGLQITPMKRCTRRGGEHKRDEDQWLNDLFTTISCRICRVDIFWIDRATCFVRGRPARIFWLNMNLREAEGTVTVI